MVPVVQFDRFQKNIFGAMQHRYFVGDATQVVRVPVPRVYDVVPRTPGIVPRAYRTHKSVGSGNTDLKEASGTGMEFLQSSSGRVWMWRTHESIGYGYEVSYPCRTRENFGPGVNFLQNSLLCPVRV